MHETAHELSAALRERYRAGVVPHETYARAALLAWVVRVGAAVVCAVGLVVATVLAFALGPELGAVACVGIGCSSIFAPVLVAGQLLRRIYLGALARTEVAGGLSFAQPFAVPARPGRDPR